MAAATTAPAELRQAWAEPGGLAGWVTSVDHKRIGVRYLVTASAYFVAAGALALLMRAQLARPDARVLSPGTYNELLTLHGVTMIFLFVTPMLSGFGNYFVPLMIGARDMAFPRLNAFSYWMFAVSGAFIVLASLAGAVPSAGWFNYVPLSAGQASPGRGIDVYAIGLTLLSISTTVGAANFIVTILRLRAPGMSLARIPIFCWAVFATSVTILFALPALTADDLLLELQRKFGWPIFDAAHGGDPLLWQHLFWVFGHPDVYIIFLPAVGIVSTIVPVFARHRLVGHQLVAVATVMTGVLGFGVWVHHMFATGLPQITLTFYAAASLLIAIPSGVQIVAWTTTLWRGAPVVRSPLLWVLGFVATFVIGGVTGVMFAAIPFDQQVTDTYFVVAHFHYVLFGGAVFPIIAALHHWLPKISGRMLDERLATVSFWCVFIGFNITFFPMHISGLLGMPRRIYTYAPDQGWDTLNLISSLGAAALAAGLALVALNIARSLRHGAPAGDDPWGGDTLEWTTTSPPPSHNFTSVPVVRSATPAWDGLQTHDGPVGHQTLATNAVTGEDAQAIAMPHGSAWPALLALALGMTGVAVLMDWWIAAAVLAASAVLCVVGWHAEVPAPDVAPTARLGLTMVLLTEGALMVCLFASDLYLRLRAGTGPWPPRGTPSLGLTVPLILTVVFAASGVLAWRRRAGVVVLACAVAAVALQVVELVDAAAKVDPDVASYGALFFTLTGVHAAHALVGLLLIAYACARSRARDLAATYWLFVAVAWLPLLILCHLTVS